MKSNNPKIGVQSSLSVIVYRLGDAICILAGLLAVRRLGEGLSLEQVGVAAASTVVVFTFASELTGNYRNWRGAGFGSELASAVMTWILTILSLLVVGTCVDVTNGFTRLSFAGWTVATTALIGLSRSLARFIQSYLRSLGINTRGYAVVGVTDLGIRLARSIIHSPQLGLNLIGFYDDRPSERTADLPADLGTRLGGIEELVHETRRGNVSMIYITFPMRAEDRIRNVLNQLSDTTASVYIVPDFFAFELLHSRWNNIHGIPVVSVFESPLYGVDGLVKRTIDLALSLVALVLLAIPMLIIAAVIRCTSPGPVFFRQRRYGLDGHEIRVWKFRTMGVWEDGDQVKQATTDDPRVTTIGRFLRRASLDELPQIFNVLRGEMSLVGPRPHANAHNEDYRHRIQGYMLRHKVRPGITGLAQVKGWRGETDTLEKMEKRIECDHQYIRDWSLWLDLKILFQTVPVVFSNKNAC